MRLDFEEGKKMTPRMYFACLWGVAVLLALYNGIAHGYSVAWWLLATLSPPLLVFVWWMADRASLERRISRLEAGSEIGDERRVTAHSDLTKVEDKLRQIERRVAALEQDKAVALARSHRENNPSAQVESSDEGVFSSSK
jgi:hypothetical protein